MRGAAPKSAHLKIATGNPGHRPIQEEPEPAGDVVKPSHLRGRASVIWDQDAPIAMGMGLLKSADVRLFVVYCKLAALTETKFSKMSVAQLTEFRRTCDYFGFSAPGRAKLGTKPATKKDAKAAKEESYFGAAG